MSEKKSNKLKLLNDPIYGFITIPNILIYDLISHPYFQRLRRISQMGLSHLVYPGAHHSRFHHAIGCMHLMQKAVNVLKYKGVTISDAESEALIAAILLHDIGHGPFSHALEHSIVDEIDHEYISLKFMEVLNIEFNGKLTLAIQIFKNDYHRKFLHQLIASQLDMDRLDYLKRDSFYTGVSEGNINSDRLIAMLDVKDDELVIEEKGIYSVEKFIVARRLMYWQVYLHKTGLVAEKLLENILKRARELAVNGMDLQASNAFSYFLKYSVNKTSFNDDALKIFAKLDDYDIISAIKDWIGCNDPVLSRLSESLINRNLPKINIRNTPFSKNELMNEKTAAMKTHAISDKNISYFVFHGEVDNQAYDVTKDTIKIKYKDGELKDIVEASDHLNIGALSNRVTKYYMCFPK